MAPPAASTGSATVTGEAPGSAHAIAVRAPSEASATVVSSIVGVLVIRCGTAAQPLALRPHAYTSTLPSRPESQATSQPSLVRAITGLASGVASKVSCCVVSGGPPLAGISTK